MAIYGIYACESTYGGLHGMNNYGFEECDDDEMANEVGIEWSYNVMDSYESIGDGFEEDAVADGLSEEDDGYDEFIDALRAENVQYHWTRLRDDCPLTLEQLKDREFNDFDELCELYREKEG